MINSPSIWLISRFGSQNLSGANPSVWPNPDQIETIQDNEDLAKTLRKNIIAFLPFSMDQLQKDLPYLGFEALAEIKMWNLILNSLMFIVKQIFTNNENARCAFMLFNELEDRAQIRSYYILMYENSFLFRNKFEGSNYQMFLEFVKSSIRSGLSQSDAKKTANKTGSIQFET